MRVLSLLQPWASLVVTPHPSACIVGPEGRKDRGIKQWETRCWKPKDAGLIYILQKEGFLIHASMGWKPEQKKLIRQWPFDEYSEQIKSYPLGMIIGHVKLDQIWTTEKWINNFKEFESEGPQEEYRFGDYSAGRFAWLLKEPILFKKPIQATGSLGFWNYELNSKDIPGL